jgi:hypothetical protein
MQSLMSNPLDKDFIDNLLKAPQKVSRARKANDLTRVESRTYTVWFTLRQTFGVCSNPDCKDQRPLKTSDGNAMCIDVNGTTMCRLCFLDGFGVTLDNG